MRTEACRRCPAGDRLVTEINRFRIALELVPHLAAGQEVRSALAAFLFDGLASIQHRSAVVARLAEQFGDTPASEVASEYVWAVLEKTRERTRLRGPAVVALARWRRPSPTCARACAW